MGRSPCCESSSDQIKRGPWTPEEDNKLMDYIQKNGPGRWRTLPTHAGLSRCGKSCRLRWTNYLRPGIKRGRFSSQEEQVILKLHSLLGNKWSRIASYLPGRTDNEIKNYWNTHIRKHLLRLGIDPVTHQAPPRLDQLLDCTSNQGLLLHHHQNPPSRLLLQQSDDVSSLTCVDTSLLPVNSTTELIPTIVNMMIANNNNNNNNHELASQQQQHQQFPLQEFEPSCFQEYPQHQDRIEQLNPAGTTCYHDGTTPSSECDLNCNLQSTTYALNDWSRMVDHCNQEYFTNSSSVLSTPGSSPSTNLKTKSLTYIIDNVDDCNTNTEADEGIEFRFRLPSEFLDVSEFIIM